ncbi:hypothetical protein K438DRAFT_1756096 [Mycena galopus ATCC 62051]|nr:hypothetical protein K438DRAFT_1756096 [Mycena galopus ATCC 62051]
MATFSKPNPVFNKSDTACLGMVWEWLNSASRSDASSFSLPSSSPMPTPFLVASTSPQAFHGPNATHACETQVKNNKKAEACKRGTSRSDRPLPKRYVEAAAAARRAG